MKLRMSKEKNMEKINNQNKLESRKFSAQRGILPVYNENN